ncbi:MAG: HEAT repeat domain-containing protein, partial [Flavobacteriales bacterium]|nr:HEAT repeat domain-containing protein [Flavobacteriales bacterium]
MRHVLPACLLLLIAACNSAERSSDAPNRWSDERLWPVLEAQEHRDTEKLCALLKDADPVVREAAALAFASVQDSAGAHCLLSALHDDAISVRVTAAFALGFVADSLTTTWMAESAMSERDSTVQRALLSASFIAMQRIGMLKEPNAILYYFDRAQGHERVRAADALRRLPDSALKALAPEYMALFGTDLPAEVEAILVRGLVKVGTREALALLRFSADADKPAVIIPNALRTLGNLHNPADDSLFFHWAGPGCVGQAALEVLVGREALDAEQCLRAATMASDARTRIVLLGLAMKHGGGAVADSAYSRLKAIDNDLR